jgi:ABC-type amino acid transport substrate-binding protein
MLMHALAYRQLRAKDAEVITMKRLPFISRLTLVLFAALVFWGGAVYSAEQAPANQVRLPQRPLLRVGVAPLYPPLIFKRDNKITGMEVDFAMLLGTALGRDVMFAEMPRTELINALMGGKIDIVMSGMTATKARQVRASFTDPYLKIGQVAMMRAQDASKYNSLTSIRECSAGVGVVKGTTGEVYVRANLLRAGPIITVDDIRDALGVLSRRRVDLFVYDAPAIAWIVSENEATLNGFWEPLNEEYLAWAVNHDDETLLRAANAALAAWKKDGTLRKVVKKWLPYWKSTD